MSQPPTLSSETTTTNKHPILPTSATKPPLFTTTKPWVSFPVYGGRTLTLTVIPLTTKWVTATFRAGLRYSMCSFSIFIQSSQLSTQPDLPNVPKNYGQRHLNIGGEILNNECEQAAAQREREPRLLAHCYLRPTQPLQPLKITHTHRRNTHYYSTQNPAKTHNLYYYPSILHIHTQPDL